MHPTAAIVILHTGNDADFTNAGQRLYLQAYPGYMAGDQSNPALLYPYLCANQPAAGDHTTSYGPVSYATHQPPVPSNTIGQGFVNDEYTAQRWGWGGEVKE